MIDKWRISTKKARFHYSLTICKSEPKLDTLHTHPRWKVKVKVLVSSVGSLQRHPFSSPGDSPDPGIKSGSPAPQWT